VGRDDVRRDPGEELVLAEVAPVGTVAPVRLVVTLLGGHLDDGDADDAGDLVRRDALVRREARRDPEQRDDPGGPSARTASASSSEESTPPEKATPSRPSPTAVPQEAADVVGQMLIELVHGQNGIEMNGEEYSASRSASLRHQRARAGRARR
jgi:hypothetical protein